MWGIKWQKCLPQHSRTPYVPISHPALFSAHTPASYSWAWAVCGKNPLCFCSTAFSNHKVVGGVEWVFGDEMCVSFPGRSVIRMLLLFSYSVVSNSLWLHGLQHARLPCPSPSPGACSNSCPSSQWCHPPISSSVVPFSLCLQSFSPASGSFLMSWFFASGHPSIGADVVFTQPHIKREQEHRLFNNTTSYLLKYFLSKTLSDTDIQNKWVIPNGERKRGRAT